MKSPVKQSSINPHHQVLKTPAQQTIETRSHLIIKQVRRRAVQQENKYTTDYEQSNHPITQSTVD